ncbi:MAG TPA: WD40 repeat domain-containing protein [Polyangia bacterium]
MTMLVALPPRLRLRARVSVEPAGRMAWTRSGDRVIVGGAETTAIVESTTGLEVERWPHAYTCFACGWDDSYVAAANARGFVDLWRFGRPRPGEPTARHGGRITAIAFSGDDRRIFTAGDDGRVAIWRAATLDAAFFAVGGRAHDLAYDGDADAIAVAAGRSGVVLLDGTSGERRAVVRPPDRATAVAWAAGLLLVGTRDGQLAAYDAKRLEPARATASLGVGAIVQLVQLGAGVVVEGADAIAFVDAATGEVRWRWAHGAAVAGGSLAVHAAQSALAIAVPAAMSILDVEPEPPAAIVAPPAVAAELLALHHPGDAALAGVVVEHLRASGASVVALADDSRRFVDVARRAAAAIVFYGPSGPPLRHDYLVDVLETRGVRVVPVILPGGAVPEAQRRFHGAAYVCFHARVHDADALARVARAVFGS